MTTENFRMEQKAALARQMFPPNLLLLLLGVRILAVRTYRKTQPENPAPHKAEILSAGVARLKALQVHAFQKHKRFCKTSFLFI